MSLSHGHINYINFPGKTQTCCLDCSCYSLIFEMLKTVVKFGFFKEIKGPSLLLLLLCLSSWAWSVCKTLISNVKEEAGRLHKSATLSYYPSEVLRLVYFLSILNKLPSVHSLQSQYKDFGIYAYACLTRGRSTQVHSVSQSRNQILEVEVASYQTS